MSPWALWGSSTTGQAVQEVLTVVERCSEPSESLGSMGKQHHRTSYARSAHMYWDVPMSQVSPWAQWGSSTTWQAVLELLTCVERCSEPSESLGSMGKQHHRTKATKATLVPINRMKSSIDWKTKKYLFIHFFIIDLTSISEVCITVSSIALLVTETYCIYRSPIMHPDIYIYVSKSVLIAWKSFKRL